MRHEAFFWKIDSYVRQAAAEFSSERRPSVDAISAAVAWAAGSLIAAGRLRGARRTATADSSPRCWTASPSTARR